METDNHLISFLIRIVVYSIGFFIWKFSGIFNKHRYVISEVDLFKLHATYVINALIISLFIIDVKIFPTAIIINLVLLNGFYLLIYIMIGRFKGVIYDYKLKLNDDIKTELVIKLTNNLCNLVWAIFILALFLTIPFKDINI